MGGIVVPQDYWKRKLQRLKVLHVVSIPLFFFLGLFFREILLCLK